jgi:hypothetical protein
MPGPTTTLGSPLNVQGGGGSAAGGTGGITGDVGAVTGQVRQQTEQFGTLLKDPGFTGQSEMSAMLKLQREVALEQMMFQTVSNLMKSRTDSSKNAIQNMR